MLETIQGPLSVLFGFYDSIFQPLLALSPYYALTFFSVALAGIFSLIYWRLLDVEKQRELKSKLKEQQEKMKEAREEEDTEKVSEHMSKSLELNQRFMMLNIKPMLATMVFVALFFPWLSATFTPNVQMDDSNSIYEGEFEYAGQTVPLEINNQSEELILAVEDQEIEQGERFDAFGFTWEFSSFGDNGGWFSQEGHSARIAGVFVPLPFTLPYIGSALNWLGFYIIMAMPMTYAFRKMLGIA